VAPYKRNWKTQNDGQSEYKPAHTPEAAGMPKWAELLEKAVTEPGRLSEMYSAFHNYSFGNQMLAAFQCQGRGLPLGPIATFPAWKSKGRFVKKGEKALTLCMPVTGHRKKDTETEDTETEDTEPKVFTFFVYKRHWFVLSQTDGKDVDPAPIPEWDKGKALAHLGISQVPFDAADGNMGGYATGKRIAINPVNPNPNRTLIHECAHIVMGHTSGETAGGSDRRDIREMEAEAVTLIICETLGFGDPAESRGYIQSWYGKGNPIPEQNAKRIFAAADKILKAGKAPEQAEMAA